MLDVAIALLTLCALCLFLVGKCRVQGGAAPLVAASLVILWLSAWGVAGALRLGGWLLYAACLALGAWTLGTAKGREQAKELLSPGFLLFAVGAVVLLGYLAVRQPPFSEWDEFATWGPMAKLLKQDNALYTTADVGWWWTTTQFPAFPIFSYFSQFFGAFAAWKVFWAYDVLMLAAFGAILAPLKNKQWRIALPAGVIAVLTPYFFNVFFRQVHLNKVYMSAYADLAAGILLGGVLALYYARRGEGAAGLWQPLVALGAVALVKENLFVLALVAAGLMAADQLLFTKVEKPKAARKIGLFALPFGAALAPYAMWMLHAGWANAQNTQTSGESTSMELGEAAAATVGQVFAQDKTPRFQQAKDLLWNAFFSVKDPVRVSMAGGGLATFLVITAVFALAVWLAGDKWTRRRTLLGYGVLLGGFVCYQFVLLVSYTYLLYAESATVVFADYDRYVTPYYTAWFVLGIALLVSAAARAAKRVKWPAKTAVLAVSCAMAVLFWVMVPRGLSVGDYPDDLYAHQRAEEEQAGRIADVLPEGARVFFVCQGGDGGEWFRYHYYLLPNVLDYSGGGGVSLAPPGYGIEGEAETMSADELEEYLQESGCEYILILRLDDVFVQGYGELFAEPLDAEDAEPALYRRDAQGRYAPVAL